MTALETLLGPGGGPLRETSHSIEALAQAAAKDGVRMFVARGQGARGKEDLLNRLGSALEMPEGFADNWDAFADGLTDLEWAPAKGYLLILEGFAKLAKSEPNLWTLAERVLTEGSNAWAERDVPFFLVLRSAP